MSNVNTSVTYSPELANGHLSDNDFIWLEQEEEQETLSLGDAASMIDAIYDRNPCNPLEQVVEAPPTEDANEEAPPPYDTEFDEGAYSDFVEYVRNQMSLYICSWQPSDSTIDISFKVVRANIDIPYELKVPISMIQSTRTVTEIVEEALTVTNARGVQLKYPVEIKNPLIDIFKASWSGSPEAEVGKSISLNRFGNSLSWEALAYGSIRVEYPTEYDVVTIRVPYSEGESSAEYNVVAFYNRLAADVDLDKPIPEDDGNADEDRGLYCAGAINPGTGDLIVGGDDDDGSPTCTATVTSVYYCNCSGDEASKSEPVDTAVSCPDYIKSGEHNLGSIEKFGGWVVCSEDSEYDPDEFEEICCLQGDGPRCKEWFTTNQGKGLDAKTLKDLTERGKKIIPVSPADGDCGTITHKYVERDDSCCDDVIPMSESPENKHSFSPGEGFPLKMLDGRDKGLYKELWEWTSSGGLLFPNGLHKIEGFRDMSLTVQVSVCENQQVTVNDGCTVLNIPIRIRSDGKAELEFPPDLIMSPDSETIINVNVVSGTTVPPFKWSASGGLSWVNDTTDGLLNILISDEDFCGMGDISIADECGSVAEGTVKSSSGTWYYLNNDPDFDICARYGAPYGEDEREGTTNNYYSSDGKYWLTLSNQEHAIQSLDSGSCDAECWELYNIAPDNEYKEERYANYDGCPYGTSGPNGECCYYSRVTGGTDEEGNPIYTYYGAIIYQGGGYREWRCE